MNTPATKDLFNKLNQADATLAADGNRYSDDFTGLAITIKTQKGRLVDYYSASQKNVTGLYFQGVRVLEKAKKSHKVVIEVS